MSSTTLYRLSGWSLLVGVVIFALGNLIHPLEHSQAAYLVSTWVEAHVLIIIGSFLLALGLPALYLRQGEKRGVLGLIGLILTLIGLASAISGSWYERTYDRTGGLNGTATDKTIHARISGDKFSGRMSVNLTDKGHTINIMQLDKGSGTYRPVASLALSQ